MLRILSNIIFYTHELLINDVVFYPEEITTLLRIREMLKDMCLNHKIDIFREVK